MATRTWTLLLRELPDPAYPPFRLMAGGDVRDAVWSCGEHLVRMLADFPAGSVSTAIRFIYKPLVDGEDSQQRLSIYLVGQAHCDEVSVGLSLLLERGPFRQFYNLQPADETLLDLEQFEAACDVVRRQSILDPTVTPEFNPKVPPAYYTIRSFEPRQDNDCLQVDSILSRLNEPALIEISVEPVDIRKELGEHTRYLSRLQQINRYWDHDDEDVFGRDFRSTEQFNLKPLRHKDPLADDILRRQQRFHETLVLPHLKFHIRAFAQTPAVARLLASVAAESAFEDGSYQLFDSAMGDSFFEAALQGQRDAQVVPAPALKQLLGERDIRIYDRLSGLASLVPVDELTSAFRLPVASYASPCCIHKNTDPPAVSPEDLIVIGHDEQIDAGGLGGRSRLMARGLHVDCLRKHAFVCGMPGNGKTTAIINMLIQLSRRRIPFIVFEPGKSEYRLLKRLKDHPDPDIRRLARELRIYTPGNERISPCRLNPLRLLDGISRNENIEEISTCFKATMPMSGPLPAILGEALEQVYEDHPSPDHPPKMADLHTATRKVLASKGYSADVDSDIRAAIEVRLGMLTRRAIGRVFQCGLDIPTLDQLVNGYSLIELACLPQEQSSLQTLSALTGISQYARTVPYCGEGPRLVVVIEEAHNLVGRNTDASPSEENADPKAYAAELICRMLAELRGLGVGIVIVDQLPSAIAPEVIKNTATKLAFRQVANSDREEIGGAMLFGSIETEEIARLGPGEAYLFTEGYFGPRRIRTPNLHAELDIPSPPSDDVLLACIADEPWFIEATATRLTAEFGQLLTEMDQFDDLRMGITKQSVKLVAEYPKILSGKPSSKRSDQLVSLAGRVITLRSKLDSAFRTFRRDVYRPLLEDNREIDISDDGLRALRDSLVDRYDSVIRPDTESCLGVLERLIRNCRERCLSLSTQGA